MSDSILDALKKSLDPESYQQLMHVKASMERKFMRLTDEVNHVRILPPIEEGKLWFREVLNHFNVGASKKGFCLCGKSLKPPTPCFVCDVIEFCNHGGPADQEFAKAMRASRVYWVNAFNVRTEIPVTKILPLNYTTFQQLFQLFLSGENFLDVENGANVVITRQPGNKYFVRLDFKNASKVTPELLDQRFNLEVTVKEQMKTRQDQIDMFDATLVTRVQDFLKTGKVEPVLSNNADDQHSPEIEQPALQNPQEVMEKMQRLLGEIGLGKGPTDIPI